jgi:hypothetical protein
MAVIAFFALAVFGLGAVSVVTDSDIISTPGLGQAPGIVGMLVAAATFALSLGVVVRRRRPTFLSVPSIALLTALAHLAAVWVVVLIASGDLIIATAVAGELVRRGPSAVLLLAAAVAAWGGVALRRTRAQHPHWPWEGRDAGE